jgi:exodeoxyribonuclease VII large subunit
MPNNSQGRSLYSDLDPISIDRLTRYIEQALLETPQLRQIWVSGEVTSATHHPSGIYFTLKDKVGKAALPAVVWKTQIPELETKPQAGMEVMVFGKVTVYAPHGKYQFQVQQILPLGEGLQALKLQRLKQRLLSEGLFDLERKQALPTHPQTIAVVTSSAAAWGDIQKTLLSRYPGVLVLLSPATVQGKTAPNSIERALDLVIIDGRAEVLILARGGGATEELSCFNSEIVVRAIAECPIPIVTGIGHERDESLADLAADIRATTPTAAAMMVVPDLEDLVDDHLDRITYGRLRQRSSSRYYSECISRSTTPIKSIENQMRRHQARSTIGSGSRSPQRSSAQAQTRDRRTIAICPERAVTPARALSSPRSAIGTATGLRTSTAE